MLAPKVSKTIPYYYGWIIALGSAVILFVIFGIRLSFSVFFVALIDEFGWTRADTSLIFTTTMIVFTLTSTGIGYALDRFGARQLFIFGALVVAVGLALSSKIGTIEQLVFTYGVVCGFGITILGLSMHASLMARWFKQNMGMAIGIAFAGTGVGAFLITPLVEFIVRRGGWRVAFLVLAGLMLLLVPFIYGFVANRPAEIGMRGEREQEADWAFRRVGDVHDWTLKRVLASPSFWLVFLAGLCSMAPVRMLTVHQLAMMSDAGIGTQIGARAIGFGGLITAVTFVASGALSDRIGRSWTYSLGGLCLIGAILILGVLGETAQEWLIWVYAILLGAGEGSRSSLVSATVGDIFSGKTVGAINGTIGAAYGAGSAFMPWYAGILFDQMGSYKVALWIAGGCVLTAVISLTLAQYYAKK